MLDTYSFRGVYELLLHLPYQILNHCYRSVSLNCSNPFFTCSLGSICFTGRYRLSVGGPRPPSRLPRGISENFEFRLCRLNHPRVIWEFRHISVLARASLQAQPEPERQAPYNLLRNSFPLQALPVIMRAVFYSLLSILILQFVARAAMAPNAASHGAKSAPTTPTVAGISRRVLPCSFSTITLVTFPS